jgi:hypothetical protein
MGLRAADKRRCKAATMSPVLLTARFPAMRIHIVYISLSPKQRLQAGEQRVDGTKPLLK